MLTGISNPFGTPIQTAAILTAAGLIAGRKFCLAAGCKLGSKVAGLMNEQKAAQLDQAGNHYLTVAKKDALRDFAAATGIVAAVGLAKCAKDSLSAKEPEEEQGYLQSYAMPTIKYGAATLATALGLRSLIRYGLYTSLAFNLYGKCHHWKGPGETISKSELPMQFVTSTITSIMNILFKL
jgi:hypothetical protein